MKKPTPNNVEGLLGDVNRLSKECRSIPFGIERESCFEVHVLPLMGQLQALGYGLEWDVAKRVYELAEIGEGGWAYPTIRLKRLEL